VRNTTDKGSERTVRESAYNIGGFEWFGIRGGSLCTFLSSGTRIRV
jgi:hypothetical protein